jgi:arsenate reductase (thioredoxin)
MKASVLFVCLHGSAKSVIAAEHFRQRAAARGLPVDVRSAGLEPDDAVPPRVSSGLLADGIDVRDLRPRRPTEADVAQADTVVAFGCDLGPLAARARRIERWDDVPAVSEDFERARDAIVARVTRLLDEVAARP